MSAEKTSPFSIPLNLYFGCMPNKKNVSTIHIYKKNNVVPVHTMKAYRGEKVEFHSFLTSA